jgi:hypothetical protein
MLRGGEVMDKFTKQSSEQFTIEIDFSRRLETGETINSYTLSAINNSTSEDVESIIVDADSNDTTSVYITVKAGTTGNKYKFTAIITTSELNIYEKDVLMEIKNI